MPKKQIKSEEVIETEEVVAKVYRLSMKRATGIPEKKKIVSIGLIAEDPDKDGYDWLEIHAI